MSRELGQYISCTSRVRKNAMLKPQPLHGKKKMIHCSALPFLQRRSLPNPHRGRVVRLLRSCDAAFYVTSYQIAFEMAIDECEASTHYMET